MIPLKFTEFVPNCNRCGDFFSKKKPPQKCPKCGGKIELRWVKIRRR